jgi:hypothetical protein
MNTMEKKIYTRPTISETKLDSDINVVLASEELPPVEFTNPLKWFK